MLALLFLFILLTDVGSFVIKLQYVVIFCNMQSTDQYVSGDLQLYT